MVLCVRVPGLSIPLEFRLKITASGAGPTLYDLPFAQRGGPQAGTRLSTPEARNGDLWPAYARACLVCAGWPSRR